MTNPSDSITISAIADGMFDYLPGAQWRNSPPADYTGLFFTAMVVKNSLCGQAGIRELQPFGQKDRMTVEYLGKRPHASDEIHPFHFLGDQFEVLMIIGADLAGGVVAYRGSREHFRKVAGRLAKDCSAAVSTLRSQSQSSSRVKER